MRKSELVLIVFSLTSNASFSIRSSSVCSFLLLSSSVVTSSKVFPFALSFPLSDSLVEGSRAVVSWFALTESLFVELRL